uniref:F-box domain-containing protein n=1 Tax=Tetranychus urticae TaxID=32264 RepID=T1L6H4_TETUR
MLINELPDDCLLSIFDYVNYLGDLINCYKVCTKWRYLIAKRNKKVKYLLEDPHQKADSVHYSGDDPDESESDDVHYKIAEYSHSCIEKVDYENIVSFIRNHKPLKGIIKWLKRPIEKHCDKLEMLSAFYIHPSIIQKVSSIKQLYLQYCSLDDFKRDAHYLPNLERLHIRDAAPCRYYDGPVLEKLKIFELDFSSSCVTDICYCFQFMDSCPNLQSAYIFLENLRFYVDETIKHQCLQDLVIVFADPPRTDWNDLKRLLMKYPNLKHLGLRDASMLNDEHIKQLLHILPNLVLFQVDLCEEITERAAYYVQDYCKRHGRSIEFYFNENSYEIEYDWPQLSTKREKISRGFDFMKHCFLKDYYDLPHFLIPIEY